VMKPNPLASLNHFTIPVVRIAVLPSWCCAGRNPLEGLQVRRGALRGSCPRVGLPPTSPAASRGGVFSFEWGLDAKRGSRLPAESPSSQGQRCSRSHIHAGKQCMRLFGLCQ